MESPDTLGPRGQREAEQGDTLLSFFSSSIVNKCPFCCSFVATLFAFLCFLLILKWPPKCSVEVLSSVSKHKKSGRCLTEQMCVLDKLHSGMSYSVVGCGFHANESTIYIESVSLNRNARETRVGIDRLMTLLSPDT